MQPLANIKVLDLTRVLAGPFCSMMLSDMGADVIKIESPGGDDSRVNPPFVNGESSYFMSLNRNKRSISMDLKQQAAKDVFFRMVKEADVVLENFRPGTMDKLGIGYDVLKKLNPRLIYCAISGFGQTGPYRNLAAYDIIVQAMGGIMSINGSPNTPTRVGASIGDIIAGLYGVIAILSAVEYRHNSGLGQSIDLGMMDCMVATVENAIVRYFVSGKVPVPIGTRHPASAPFDLYKTKDGAFIIGVAHNGQWEKCCHIIGREELIKDPRFVNNADRLEHEAELKVIIEEIFAHKSSKEWMDEFVKAGIPCGPVNTIQDVVNDPHVQHREMVVEIPGHPTVGPFRVAGMPIKFSESPCAIKSPAPVLGQHTDEVLRQFAYTEEEIKALRATGAVIGSKLEKQQ